MPNQLYHPYNQGLVTPAPDTFVARGNKHAEAALAAQQVPNISGERQLTPDAPEPTSELGFIDAVGKAYVSDSIIGDIVMRMQQEDWEVDPSYVPPEDMDYLATLSNSDQGWLLRATSETDYLWRQETIAKKQAAAEELANAGFTGTAATLVAAFIDVDSMMGLAGELALINKLAKANKLTRTSSAASSAGFGAATVAGGAIIKENDLEAEAIVVGALLAGAMGGLFPGIPKAQRDIMDDAAKGVASSRPHHASAAESTLNKPSNFNPAPRYDEDGALIPTTAEYYRSKLTAFLPDAAEKARANKFLSSMAKYNPLASEGVKWLHSKSRAVAGAASDLLEIGTGAVNNRSASALRQMFRDRWMSTASDQYYSGMTSYGERMYKNVAERTQKSVDGSLKKEFDQKMYDELAARRMEAQGDSTVANRNVDNAIKDAADSWDATMRDVLATAQERGLMEGVTWQPGYVPLLWDGNAMLRMKGQTTQYRNLLKTAYENMGIESEAADAISEAVFKRALNRAAGIDADPSVILAKDNRENLIDMLTQEGVSHSKATQIADSVQASRDTTAGGSRAKKRTSIDLTATDAEGRRLLDLVDNDMESIMRNYAEDMSGRTALAEKGILSDTDWTNYKRGIADDMLDSGYNTQDITKMMSDLDGVRQGLRGKPRAGGTNTNLRRLMEFSRLGMMGGMGFSQAAEQGALHAAYGSRAFLTYSPEMQKMMRKVSQGDRDNLLGEIGSLGGDMWNEHHLLRANVRLDDSSATKASIGKQVDRALATGNKALAVASGFKHINSTQRATARILGADKIAKHVMDTGADAKTLARFQSMGMGTSERTRIKSMIERHAEFDANGNLNRLNLEKWDGNTAEDFFLIVDRQASQVVQGTRVGEEAAVFGNSQVARLIGQYMNFPIAAMEKQFGRNISIADQESFMTFVATLATANLAYAARSVATGREHESDEQFIRGALNYWSQIGYLAEAVDIAAAAGVLPPEAHSRNLGRMGQAHGVPGLHQQFAPASFSTLQALGTAASVPGTLFWGQDSEISDSQARSLKMALPFGNTVPAMIMWNAGE